jgi:hypothetical protein
MVSELRRMAAPLLERPLTPLNTIAELKARSRRRRHYRLAAASGSVVSVALVVVLLVAAFSTGTSPRPRSGTLASYIETGVSVPDSVLEQVGLPADVTPPTALQGQPLLTDGGLPAVVFIGAEYCPYCAIERWALIVALSRFGDFSSLGQAISSSSTDVYPGLQSWSFHGSSFASTYLTFDPAEVTTSTPDGSSYTPLDTLTPLQQQVYDTYDGPPYASLTGGIPFVDVGNEFLVLGASSSPAVLENLSLDQIASTLSDPSNPIAQAVDGSANYLIANLCAMTGSPATVPMCSSPIISQARSKMPKASG